jgi:hypothetical protein
MAEGVSMAVGAKWLITALGSAIGSAVGLAVTPAKNHRDASIRFASCAAFTVCLAPISTRGAAKWLSVSSESIPDLTLGVAAVFGLACWSIVGGVVRVAEKYSKRIEEEGLAALSPGKKTP